MINHYDLSIHGILEFHTKYLSPVEIEVILEIEFSFTVDCCVCGYHIFKLFWEAPIGSVLNTQHEVDLKSLIHGKFAIALVNNNFITVGHIPNVMSKLTLFPRT